MPSILDDPGYLFSGNNTQAAMEGDINAQRARNILAQEKARAIEMQLAEEEAFDPTRRAIESRKADLEYERLLPAGSKSFISAEFQGGMEPEAAGGYGRIAKPGYLRGAPRLIEQDLGGLTAGEDLQIRMGGQGKAGGTGQVDYEVESIRQRGRARGLSPEQIEQAIQQRLKERTVHGAIGKGDYGTAGKILFPEAYRRPSIEDELAAENAAGQNPRAIGRVP